MCTVWRWISLIGALCLALSGGVPGLAQASTERVGGWFVFDERLPDGTFSHCLMLNAYPRGRDRVLLSISLAPSRRALLTVTDPAWSALPGHGDTGSLTFDHPPALSMRATGTGTLLRLDLPPWSQVRALLKSAKVLRVTGRGHTALFHLLDMDAAITVLESCAATGKPSLSQVPFAPRP